MSQSYIYEVHLPRVNDIVYSIAREIEKNKGYRQESIFPYKMDEVNRSLIDAYNKYNFCAQSRYSNFTLIREIKKLFRGTKVNPYLVFNYNFDTNYPTSLMMPHCDSSRHLALNYVIKLGGSNITNSFFDEFRPDTMNKETPFFRSPDDFKSSKTYKLKEHAWYIFNPQEFHTVCGIEDCRVLLMVDFIDVDESSFIDRFISLSEPCQLAASSFADELGRCLKH